MNLSILNELQEACLTHALAGTAANASGLCEFLPELERLGSAHPSFKRAAELVRDIVEGEPDRLPILCRLLMSIETAGLDFGKGGPFSALPAETVVSLPAKQTSYRKLAAARALIERRDSGAERILEEYAENPASFDPRLTPLLISLAQSDQIRLSGLATRVLKMVSSFDSAEDPKAEFKRAIELAGGGNIRLLIQVVRALGEQVLPDPVLLRALPELLPKYKKYPSFERELLCTITGCGSRDALFALEEHLEHIRRPRAVFALALQTYPPGQFYARYRHVLLRHIEKNDSAFRDAVICHAMSGKSLDAGWSDYFASKGDRLAALVTLGPDSARALNFLRSFRPLPHAPPSQAELLLNLALIPRTLLRMEVYDFWEELSDYLAAVIRLLLESGSGLDALLSEQIVFTLSLNGSWLADRLSARKEADSSELSRLLGVLYETVPCASRPS